MIITFFLQPILQLVVFPSIITNFKGKSKNENWGVLLGDPNTPFFRLYL